MNVAMSAKTRALVPSARHSYYVTIKIHLNSLTLSRDEAKVNESKLMDV